MLIHKMRLDEYMAVLDVNSGAVHLVDDVIYDLLDVFDGTNDDESIAALQTSYPEKDLREALEELHQLQAEGLLFSPEFEVPQTFAETPILKSLCLHIAHDCNLRCGYCFAGTGDFGGYRAMMSKETAEKAVEFAIAGSKMRHNLELDLFGGEPLLNPEVVKHVINYVRRREFETGKNIKLTLTTNGTLLNDDIIQFLNDNRVMLVLSLDGKKETHDNMRPFPNKTGSYDAAVRGFKKVIESRNGKNYYLRGTYTHFNPHFAEDTLDMTKIGKELSVEPVVGIDEPYVLTEADLPVLYEEYDKLAKEMIAREKAGKGFNFFHFMIDLTGGPCVYKRLSGCGSGTEYLAVTPWGDLYPCHQFVGEEKYLMGNVDDGITRPDIREEFKECNVYSKEKCRNCFAKFYCSGGCAANSYKFHGSINDAYDVSCELERKRVECAIMIKAAQAEKDEERANEEI